MSVLAASVVASGIIYVYRSDGFEGTRAEGTLTLDTGPTDGDTFTIDTKTYTLQTTLTDVDGNIQIGATLNDTQNNIVGAINLTGNPGVDYAASMTIHPTCSMDAFSSDDAIVRHNAGGTAGNSIATTETFTAPTNVFDAATLGSTTAGVDGVFKPGDDINGDGTASAPYALPRVALAELTTHIFNNEGNSYDKNYEIRIVGELGESNVYTSDIDYRIDNTFATIGAFTTGTTSAKPIMRGWKKSWGDVQTQGHNDKWTDSYDLEKPIIKSTVGYIRIAQGSGVNSGFSGPTLQWKDLIFDMVGYSSEGFSLLFTSNFNNIGHGPTAPYQYYQCIFRGGHLNPGHFSSNLSSYIALVGCIWENAGMTRIVGTNATDFITLLNCVCTNISDRLYTQTNRITVQGTSSIFRSTAKIHQGPGAFGTFVGNFCVMHRVGAVMSSGTSGTEATLAEMIANQTGSEVYQQRSFDLDPLFLDFDNNDFRVDDLSIAAASGGKTPGLTQQSSVVDVDSKGWDQFDFLGNRWADTANEIFDMFGSITAIRTRRSVGAFQNFANAAPENPGILFPTVKSEGNPQHIVIEGKASPQGGTLQAQVAVAEDADFTQNVIIKDSVPLTVDGTNKFLDIKEDGGSEVTTILSESIFSTEELRSHIETQLNGNGSLNGTYTVTYDGISGTDTRLFTITVSGAVTNFQILWHTGTNVLNSARGLLGFRQFDTTNSPSHVSAERVRENFYDSTLTWEYANDYVAGQNPATSGTWANTLGTGKPGPSGVPGTDGAPGDGLNDIRVDLPAVYGLNGKFVRGSLWSGAEAGVL